MAKQPSPKKRLLYRGAFYDSVELPGTLMYRGAFYDAVQSSLVVAVDEDEDEPAMALKRLKLTKKVKDLEDQLAARKAVENPAISLKDSGDELAPEDISEEDNRYGPLPVIEKKPTEEHKIDERELPWKSKDWKDKEKVHSALAPFVAQLTDDVRADLNKHRITTSAGIGFLADEADGVDVGAPLVAGGFSSFGGTYISFDYRVDLPDEYLEALRTELNDKGLAEVEKEGFLASLLSNIDRLREGRVRLQEVVFQFCKHGFAAPKKYVDELLSAVGFLQNVSNVHPGALLEVPTEESSDEDKKIWASDIFKQIIENEMHHNAGVDLNRKADWGKKEKMEEVIRGLTIKKILETNQSAVLTKVLDAMRGTEYAELIRDILAPSQSNSRFTLRDKVEAAVKELTRKEKYNGEIKFGVHDDGNIVASIDAPYPFQYVFSQGAGGKIKLEEAGVEICDFSFVVNNAQDAEGLLTASLSLADAYKRAVNPTLSKNRKERDAEELFLKIHDLSKKILEKDELTDSPPTEEEALKPKTPKAEE